MLANFVPICMHRCQIKYHAYIIQVKEAVSCSWVMQIEKVKKKKKKKKSINSRYGKWFRGLKNTIR